MILKNHADLLKNALKGKVFVRRGSAFFKGIPTFKCCADNCGDGLTESNSYFTHPKGENPAVNYCRFIFLRKQITAIINVNTP